MSTIKKEAATSYDVSTARDHHEVTPSDSDVYDPPFRAVFVGTGGDVAIKSLGGTTAVYKNVPDGGTIFCAGTQILDTGTDADDIVAQF